MRAQVNSHDETLRELKPAIDSLTEAVVKLHDNHGDLVRHVDLHITKAMDAIKIVAASATIIAGLLAYVYLNDQRSQEKIMTSMMMEHKVMQEQIARGIERDARSAAERELMFKALLRALDRK